MPIGYGSSPKLPMLPSSEIAIFVRPPEPAPESKGFDWVGAALAVVGLGVSFIPGIGTAGGIAIEAAVGTAMVANTKFNRHEDLTASELIGDYAGALIPVAGAGLKNVLSAGKLIRGSFKSADNILETVAKLKKINTLDSLDFADDLLDQGEKLLKASQAVTRNPLTSSLSQFSKALVKQGVGAGNEALGLATAKSITRSIGNITAGLGAGNKAYETYKLGSKIADALTEAGVTTAEIEALAALLRGVASISERNALVVKFFKSIGKLDILEKVTAELIQAGKAAEATSVGFFTKSKQWVKKYVRTIGRPNSKEFNDNFVQKVQLAFDGNDAGRAPIEFAYGKLKRYFNTTFKSIEKTLKEKFPKLFKGMTKAAKVAKKADDLFVKTGGILIGSSVIRGYKVIEERFGGNLIQIAFYPSATMSTKNPNGKDPVFVFATDREIEGLIAGGMSYYLKKWASSKNGSGMGRGMLGAIFGSSVSVLAFFHINALRNILSLASNISGAFISGIGGTGAFTGGWRNKFKKSFSRNWKNRVGRLVGRVIGGGAFGVVNKRLGAFVGRELQRLSSQVVIPKLEGKSIDVRGAVLASVTSNVRRVARAKNPTAPTLKAYTYQRNAGIVQRIPGSFSGGLGAISKLKF